MEAQTLANVYQALDANHEIVPVLNKVDLPAAEPDRVKEQIEEVIGLDASDAVPISAKTGLNIEAVLEAIVTRLPPPKGKSLGLRMGTVTSNTATTTKGQESQVMITLTGSGRLALILMF